MCVLGQILCVLMLVSVTVSQEHHTNEWAVHIPSGLQAAQLVADDHDFDIVNKVFDDVYLLRHRRLARRSAIPYAEHHEKLIAHPEVSWAEQQVVKQRVKRDFLARATTTYKSTWLNDPKWPQMWYLNRGGNLDMNVQKAWAEGVSGKGVVVTNLDMNVQKAWAEGVSGKGVVVTILDDGLEKDHPDLIKNYDPNASYDVNSHDADPMPRYDLIDSNRHGTRCAGEVAADGNNSICAVGVAYEASVGGVRMLDGDVTDAVEARSLALNPQHIDIYSASWGPDDDGKTVDGPGQLATRAFIEGITRGRSGKGSIFVWASGNGGRDQDNCNCDGYTNSIWTLSISSATEKGRVPWYSEACSSTLATTYSSGSLGERQIVTTDLHHSCTTSHTGTSASAPLAAAICALALQVNRDISWRDMQHIVLRTARPENLEAPDWQTNGVGRKVSHRFGYGLMDAYGMVQLAKNWTSVPTQKKCEVEAPHVDKLIPQKSFVTLELEVKDCPGVNYLEHVQAKVSLTADRRGEIEIYLTSPAGTKSTLLAQRPHDSSRSGFHSWPFMTVHMWGEKPLGMWQLEIHNNGHFFSTGKAEIKEWSLVLHGTETEPGVPAPSDIGSSSKSSSSIDVSSQSIYPPQHTDKQASTRVRDPSPADTTPLDASVTSAAPPTPTPIMVLATGASTLPPGCKATDASGACIECDGKDLLYDGKCVSSCPSSYYEHRSETSDVQPRCSACHYSCRSCSGPQDDQCIQCWDDATVYQPNNAQTFCHAKALLVAYRSQQSWYTFVLVLLLVLLVLVLVLGIMVLRMRKNHGSGGVLQPLSVGLTSGPKSTKLPNGRSSYTAVSRTDSDLMTKIPFHDLTSDEEI